LGYAGDRRELDAKFNGPEFEDDEDRPALGYAKGARYLP